MNYLNRPRVLHLFCAAVIASTAQAATFTPSSFATGSAIGATKPDSIVTGDGSLWAAYTNGADSAGASGSSTVVRYNWAGKALQNWTVAGNVDGLRIDPATGLVWALQNNDGNAALTTINPVSGATASYAYGASYNNPSARGFDDAQFLSSGTFLSETNPASGSDPIVLRLTAGPSGGKLQVSGILNSSFTGLNLATGKRASTTITDPDSLIAGPNGSLVLTGEADRELVFINNPGTSRQTVSFLLLSGVAGSPDDTVYPAATTGFFYIADTGANTIYKLSANGLPAGSAFVDIGSVLGQVNLTTGAVTPIFTGVAPHGVAFVAAVPEPASVGLLGLALLLTGLVRIRERKARLNS